MFSTPPSTLNLVSEGGELMGNRYDMDFSGPLYPLSNFVSAVSIATQEAK